MKLHTLIHHKLIISSLIALEVFVNSSFIVLAQTAPTAPTQPTVPTAPTQPPAPTAPTAPTQPTAPTPPPNPLYTTPTPVPSTSPENPQPTSAPTPVPTTAPTNPTTTPAPTTAPTQPNPTLTTSPTSSTPTNSTGSQSDPGDVEIETGDANNSGIITTDANTNVTLADPTTSQGVSLANTGNGTDSTNSTSIDTANTGITFQTNNANVDNGLDLGTTTGNNNGSANVGNTTVSTGDANTTGTIVNSVNTNIDGVAVAEFNVLDDHIGDIILDFSNNCVAGCTFPIDAANTGNGSGSDNNLDVNQLNDQVTFQTNNAQLNNEMNLFSDSGNNLANDNTNGDTVIYTGDANVSANVINMANNNFTGDVIYSAVNIFGDLVGDIIFPEEAMQYFANTGNGSNSNNQIDSTTVTNDTIFQNNQAVITNNLNLDTTTGENKTSANTGGENNVQTGDTNVTARVTNIANMNVVGDMWMVLVNSAGNWLGKIIGANTNGNMAGSEGIEFMVAENGDVTVTNAGNGTGSTNIGNIYQQNNSTLVQSNTANINNDINLSANTGGNSASRNTGGESSIVTGDANIVTNIVNFVNNNIKGDGRLFVNMVNVFGSWVGNFITPGAQTPTTIANQGSEPSDTPSGTLPPIGGTNALAQANQRDSSMVTPTPATPSEDQESDSTSNQLESSDAGVTTVQKKYPGEVLPRIFRYYQSKLGLTPAPKNQPQVQGITVGNTEGSTDSGSLDAVFASANQIKKDMTTINLAWLILLIPPVIVFYLIRRRLAKAKVE